MTNIIVERIVLFTFEMIRKLTLPLPVFDFEKIGASKCQIK
jgi:hypothetical protein